MRKSLLALVCLLATTAAAPAAEVLLLDFDQEQKTVTVKEEGKEPKTYKVTGATKFYGVDPDGNAREMPYADAAKGLGSARAKNELTFNVETKGDEITEARFKARKKK